MSSGPHPSTGLGEELAAADPAAPPEHPPTSAPESEPDPATGVARGTAPESSGAPLPDPSPASRGEAIEEGGSAFIPGDGPSRPTEALPSPTTLPDGHPTHAGHLDPEWQPRLTLWARGAGLLGFVGGALGLGAGIVTRVSDMPGYLTQNRLEAPSRLRLLAWVALGALVVVGAAGLAVWTWARRLSPQDADARGRDPRDPRNGRPRRFEELGRRAAPLAIAGVLPALFQWQAWRDHDVDFLVLVAAVAAVAGGLVRMALAAPPLFGAGLDTLSRRLQQALLRARLRPQRFALAIVVLGSAGYATFFSFFTIRYHHNLHSTSFDLALEENILWNILHGFKFFRSSPFSGSSGSHFGNHATFFSYLIAPIYAIYQHAETLLVIQAILMGAAAIPLFFFARRNLGAWMGCAIALTYLLYPPLHGAALYDFHYLPLGPVFLWSSLYCLEARRDRWALLFILLTISVREDVAVGLGIVGAYLVLGGKRPKAGLLVGALGAGTFVLLKLIVMPRFAGHDSFVYMYSGLLPTGESTFGGVLKTVASNPAFTFASLIERDKLIYVLQLFVPLAFLPFRRPLGLLFVTTGLLFTLLSTGYAPLIQTSFQYTTHWTSYLFIGLVATFAWLRRADALADALPDLAPGTGSATPATPIVRRHWLAGATALACAILPTTYQYGAVLQQHTVRGGFGVYDFDTTPDELAQRAQLAELLRMLPRKATVAGSENLVPQFSNRAEAYTLRTGNFGAEYLLFTLPLRSDERPYVFDPVKNGEYGLVAMSGPFALARRGHSTALNGAVIPRM